MNGVTDLAIARAARMRSIMEIGEERLGIPAESLDPYGRYKAKIASDFLKGLADRPRGRLVLVTAISPTPAGEGKTTTSVGLGDALNRIGKRAVTCLREPSLGPCFGMKGGAAGGGRSQVVPMEDINLHFTGDFHAVTAAHNLLAALVDNHIHHGAEPGLDPRRVVWNRVLDMNDRALRRIVCGLGGPANGIPRESSFDIAVASEAMAILCLAEDIDDLVRRLGNIVVGETPAREPVTAADIGAAGAMAVLLKDALRPNLVQTLENNPVLIHGGPFANIAHGCNSLIATRAALGLADYVVTEAGFGADLGAEKFFDIKCRKGGLVPDAAVLVATIRALKMHGGVAKGDLAAEDAEAVRRGGANLARHVANLRRFGVPAVVALNSIDGDCPSEIAALAGICDDLAIGLERCSHWADGGKGAESLAEAVASLAESGEGQAKFAPLYPDAMKLRDKLHTIATRIYGAADIAPEPAVERRFERFEAAGYGHFPICVAKTQYSFSADPKLLGAPDGHVLPVRELRLARGAEFVVAICGEIMTMPGLPRHPAALSIGIDPSGEIAGLF